MECTIFFLYWQSVPFNIEADKNLKIIWIKQLT